MRALHSVSAVIELGAGLALLVCPSTSAALLVGAPLETPAALSVARVGGAGLFSLGIACWFSRDDAQSRAAKGLNAAMLFYNFAAVNILALAHLEYGIKGVALWPAALLHAVMAVWCVAGLRSRSLDAVIRNT